MSAIGVAVGDLGLANFLIIGVGSGDLPCPSFWTMEDDLVVAKRVAMSWLISGYSTRVIDLKTEEKSLAFDAPDLAYFAGPYQQVMPELTARYSNLQDVIDEAAAAEVTITKYCLRTQPVVMPTDPFPDDKSYFEWLKEQSEAVPSWPVVKATVVKTQASSYVAPLPQSVAEGVTHICPHWGSGTLCGCSGHVESDVVAFDVPLRRSEAAKYCPECVQLKTMEHNDYMRVQEDGS